MKRTLVIAIALLVGSCDRHDDVITEKSPFLEIVVGTPSDGGVGVVNRSREFAHAN